MKSKDSVKDIICFIAVCAVLVFLLITQIYENDGRTRVAVHIKGEVVSPGYYELKDGARLNDAIKKAGGVTQKADVTKVNLAMVLVDGEEIYIPEKGEEAAQLITTEAKVTEETSENEKININTADMFLLCRLDGVGESTAQKIMDYREKKGSFKSIEDIMKVEGIGNAKFQKIKNKITV